MEDDYGLLENINSGDGEEWLDLRPTLNVEHTSIQYMIGNHFRII